MPEDHLLLVLEDFNTRVGSSYSELEKHQWAGVRGSHRVGKMNKSGAVLLSFSALNCFSIMNTYFEKCDAYKYNWQHPGSKL